MAQDRKSPVDPTPGTPVSPVGETVSLVRIEELTGGLSFLDTIKDFSDVVDFWSKCDQIAHGEPPTGRKESEKKCRNCS